MRISLERFEALAFEIADAVLDELPSYLRREAEQVVLMVEARPTPGQSAGGDGMLLLGLYQGVPLVERHADGSPLAPDRIILFHEPLQSMARTEAELRYHIRHTLVHELGHFFGFDEEELQQRGWG